MQGKGLESLIPKKVNVAPPQPVAPVSPSFDVPRGEHRPHKHGWETPPPLFYHTITHDDRPRVIDHGAPKPFPKSESIFHIEIEKIRPNPYQPRHEFNPEALEELAQSIREFGIIQPLVVTKIERESTYGTEVEYQLIAGERRLMAAKKAGLERVPVIVRQVGDARAKLEMALIENIQRSNLNPMESAHAYARLQDEFGLAQREIAVRVGKSRETVANTMRLLNLPLQIQEAISTGKMSESQARTLLSLENHGEQMSTFGRILENKISVRTLREEVAKKPQNPTVVDPQESYWEKRLEEGIGAPVKVVSNGARGKIVIQFYSLEEKRSIFEKLVGEVEE